MKIIALYKSGKFKLIDEMKLTEKILEKTKILLVPSLSNAHIYYIVLPDKRLLSDEFIVDIQMDIGEIDYENEEYYLDSNFTTHRECHNIIGFIDYISIFYKLYGSADMLSELWFNECNGEKAIYPSEYRIQFVKHNKVYDTIESGKLPRLSDKKVVVDSSYWLIERRMKALSSILIDMEEYEHGAIKLPNLILLSDNTERWHKIKENELRLSDTILVKCGSFCSYYLTFYSDYKSLCSKDKNVHQLPYLNVILTDPEGIMNSEYRDIADKFPYKPQLARESLYGYLIKDGMNYVDYIFQLRTSEEFINWICFAKDTMLYLAVTMHELCTGTSNLIFIRHLSNQGDRYFSIEEIMNGSFESYLFAELTRR